ncbi:DUF5334 family protein [Aurantimonas sp. 22II-16-19i]|uniref:DUF5334 family protein n=1 Tax=Aurantimonas sp. 22II-16-19i TaxID=1317114 RepID=UPI0009F7E9B5|nr:DUF5334 family protein [Aurantimonas sp. 22II-16-19i]ORE87723.1 hypothetical protein ATO4_25253 [Aurantimonas sp. 22II-16-19i]
MRHLSIALLAIFCTHGVALAWDGVDTNSGDSVEIDRGNLVREGLDIEVYDHSTGEYHDVTVEGINRSGSSVDVEVYDNKTGEYRTFEMEDGE